MNLNSLINADAILPMLRAGSKRALLHELCVKAAELSNLSVDAIEKAVLQREVLGSTGVGNGIAIPHGKLLECERIFGVFARLDKPIDFDAVDGLPVDLVFLLVAPEDAGAAHLKALASVARLLRDPQRVARLRNTRDAAALHWMLVGEHPDTHAA